MYSPLRQSTNLHSVSMLHAGCRYVCVCIWQGGRRRNYKNISNTVAHSPFRETTCILSLLQSIDSILLSYYHDYRTSTDVEGRRRKSLGRRLVRGWSQTERRAPWILRRTPSSKYERARRSWTEKKPWKNPFWNWSRPKPPTPSVSATFPKRSKPKDDWNY